MDTKQEPPAASKLSPDGTQHSDWHDVTVSIVQLAVLTTLATSFYAQMPCINFGEVLRFLPEICIAFEAMLLKLHAKLAPGWALIRVNFDPIQEIGPKEGGWALFRESVLFSRDYGNTHHQHVYVFQNNNLVINNVRQSEPQFRRNGQ